MSANAGVDILENGLVFSIDAGNRRCYPGTGTSALDISGNANNCTLNGGVVYSTSNNGIFTFDGADDYISTDTNQNLLPTAGLTICAWIKTSVADKWCVDKANSAGGQGYIFAGTSSGTWSINVNAVGVQSVSTYTSNTWRYIVGTWTPSTNLKLYFNGILDATNTTSIPATITDPSTNLWIARRRNGADLWNGSIAYVSIYSRALSDAEVSQNFNALRGRFAV